MAEDASVEVQGSESTQLAKEESSTTGCRLCDAGREIVPTLDSGLPAHLIDRGWYPCTKPPDLRRAFFELAEAAYAEALVLLKKKNDDYSPGLDPFKNFRRQGTKGVIVRLFDKMARLETFEERGDLVNESLRDACIDAANYAIIFLAMKTLEIK